MASLYTHQDANVRKTWLLVSLFLVLVVGVGFFFARLYASPGILYAAVVFSLFMNVLSYWYSDKIALAVSGARPAQRKEYPELYRLTENLCITAGLPLPRLYIIPDPAPNAFATGRNKEHAAVAVTTGLLERLSRTELEGVVAHELSHIGNRDILLSTVVVVLVGFVSILADMFLRSAFWGGGERNNDRGHANALMIVGIIFAILVPVVATLIQLAISRKREFLADASGALLTRYPEGLASALEKIAAYPISMKRAANATAHLYIANPFRGQALAHGAARLFMTHPPVKERVAALRGLEIS